MVKADVRFDNNMNDEKQHSAKELFMHYGGSFFHMDRGGDYEEYKSHNVSKQVEQEWIEEYRTETLRSLESCPDNTDPLLNFFHTIEAPIDTNLLAKVSGLVERNKDRMDSFGKLLYAEQLQQLLERSPEIREGAQSLMQKAVRLLDDVIRAPLQIGPYHSSLDYLQDILNEDTISERAQRCRYYLTE